VSTGSFSIGLFGLNILGLDPNDPEEFVIAHELTHLKECHSLITFGTSLGLIIGLERKFGPLIIFAVVQAYLLGIGRICETRADSNAISACSSLELANSYSMFRKHHYEFLDELNQASFFGKLYTKIESKLDVHPDSLSRMMKIKAEIENKRLSNLDYIPLTINRFDSAYSEDFDDLFKISENKCSEEAHKIRQILCSGKKGDLFYNVSRLDIYTDRIDVWKDGHPIPYPNEFIMKDSTSGLNWNYIDDICKFLANSDPVIIAIWKGDMSIDEENEIKKNWNILSTRKRQKNEDWYHQVINPTILVLKKIQAN
jgi:hypothetical protein